MIPLIVVICPVLPKKCVTIHIVSGTEEIELIPGFSSL
jgi:hypothetical protein